MNPPETTVRRRPFLGITGLVSFICLFLPALRVCGTPEAPTSFPPVYVLYIGGLVLAIGAIQRLARLRRAMFGVLLGLWLVTLGAIVVAWVGAASLGVAGIVAPMILAMIVIVLRWAIRKRPSDRAMTYAIAIHAVLAAAWNLLLAADPDGMYGAYLGLAAACAMLLEGLVMIALEHRAQYLAERALEPAALPVARVL